MAMLKRIRRQFSGGSLGSLTSSGRRRMPRLGSLSSLPSADDGGAKNCAAGNVAADDGSIGYTHDAAGRRKLDGLIAARRWDRIGELLSTDDGRDYVRSVAVLREDADVPATSAAAGNANNGGGTTTTTTTTAPKFISIFHHIVLSDPPPDLLSDLVGLVGVSQLLRRDDIRPYYAVDCGTTAGRRRASRRSSNSARITHEGVAWTPLHTAVAFCVRQDESATATASSAHHRLSGMINSNKNNSNKNKKKKKPRVDPATVGVLLRHFPALPSITCGKTSVTPLMIEASKGPRADMRLCKRMVDACPTAILIADGENRTAVEYALGAENLRLYRNLHHLYNDEMQKMNGLESRKRMAHSLMAGGGGWGNAFGSSGVDLYSNGVGGAAAAAAAGGGVGDVRKRREGSLTGLHCRAVRDAAEMVAQEELLLQEDGGGGIEEESIDLGLEGSGLTGDVTKSDKMKRSSSRSSNRSSTSAAA